MCFSHHAVRQQWNHWGISVAATVLTWLGIEPTTFQSEGDTRPLDHLFGPFTSCWLTLTAHPHLPLPLVISIRSGRDGPLPLE